MECKEFSSRIDAYLDGGLSGEQEQAFLAHAKKCSACNARLKAAQEAIALTRALRSKAPDFITPALEKISKEKKRKQMRRVGFAGVAAALLLCCISAIMLQYIGKGADQQNSAVPQEALDESTAEGGSSFFSTETQAQEESGAVYPENTLILDEEQAQQLIKMLSEEQREHLISLSIEEGKLLYLKGMEEMEEEVRVLLEKCGISSQPGQYDALFLPGVE